MAARFWRSPVALATAAETAESNDPSTPPTQTQPQPVEEEAGPPVRLAVIGAGQRGCVYAAYAQHNTNAASIVAVAEPRSFRREQFAQTFGVPSQYQFADWRDLLALPTKIADAVLICVQDSMHAEVAVAFAALKYHILLEKPMAVTVADCMAIYNAVTANEVMLAVGHVLRYTDVNLMIRETIAQGRVGRVIGVQHLEPIGYFHFAHSYVRGNWRKEAEATFSLMAKSCHDLDLLQFWLGSAARKVSSFGQLNHFHRGLKPAAAGAAVRCLDCAAEPTCPYSARKIYLQPTERGLTGWPMSVVADTVDIPSVLSALKTGPYGRCVYECDNDVVDHQAVLIEFESGQVATFIMTAFSEFHQHRKTRIFGTHGELIVEGDLVVLYDFLTGKTQRLALPRRRPPVGLGGHGGGDFGLIDAFVKAIARNDPTLLLSGPRESLASHLLVFAAEQARRTGEVIDFRAYCETLGIPIESGRVAPSSWS